MTTAESFGDDNPQAQLSRTRDLADYFGSIQAVRGVEYAKALSGAKMCLAFLSKLNRDTYTRRCFEIPACGRVLLCERTADMQGLLREGDEAVWILPDREIGRSGYGA